jgi:hypothetical protein
MAQIIRPVAWRTLAPMTTVLALSEAWKATIGLLFIFAVLFPAIVTGLIVFAIAQAMAERQQNLERRTRR